jgi:hypothetical protein
MPRNGSGVYSLPAGNPVVDGTVIDVAWANPTMSDIAVQLNNVVTRDGLLGPTVPLLGVDGSAALPGFAFGAQPSTGMFRTASALGFSFAGAERFQLNATGAIVAGTLAAAAVALSGDLTITKANPSVVLSATASGQNAAFFARTAGVDRWQWGKGAGAESGADAGSEFYLNRYNDAGGFLGSSLTIRRSDSFTTLGGTLLTYCDAAAFGLYMRGRPDGISAIMFQNNAGTETARLFVNSVGALTYANTGATARFGISTNGDGLFITSGLTASLILRDTGASGAGLKLEGNGGATPNKFIRAAGGQFQIMSSDYSRVLLDIFDNGDFGSSGNGYISKANPFFGLQASGAGQTATFYARTAASDRWQWGKNATAESGANAGSDFFINRYSDAGAYLDTPILITRSTGRTTMGLVTIADATLTAGTAPTRAAGDNTTNIATTAFVRANDNPVGTIIDYAGTAAPAGYLACPLVATNISRTTYAALFAAIGTTWGVGDGSTTFGCPWFPANYAAVQANANVGTATVGQNLAHTHTASDGSGFQTTAAGVAYGSSTTGSSSAATTSSDGGSANLAAGHRILKCVKV